MIGGLHLDDLEAVGLERGDIGVPLRIDEVGVDRDAIEVGELALGETSRRHPHDRDAGGDPAAGEPAPDPDADGHEHDDRHDHEHRVEAEQACDHDADHVGRQRGAARGDPVERPENGGERGGHEADRREDAAAASGAEREGE